MPGLSTTYGTWAGESNIGPVGEPDGSEGLCDEDDEDDDEGTDGLADGPAAFLLPPPSLVARTRPPTATPATSTDATTIPATFAPLVRGGCGGPIGGCP
ncbi:hypothetical protein GCM10020000_60370 [Streptomyces olivoverticillatus]